MWPAAPMETAPTLSKKITAALLGWASSVSPTRLSPLFFLQRRYRRQREKPPYRKINGGGGTFRAPRRMDARRGKSV